MKNKTNILIIIFFVGFLLIISCSEKSPEVKVQNNSSEVINVYFRDNNCLSCQSISFLDVQPYTETEYRECSTRGYTFSVKVNGEEKISDVKFYPNSDEKYVIVIDSDFKCIIRSLH